VKNVLKFEAILKLEDEPNICGKRTKAFILYIHKPNEIPTPFLEENFVQIESAKEIFLSAKYFTADESLKRYSADQRRCFFEGEKRLKLFTFYTKAQCEFECLTNFTLKSCGCVRLEIFYLFF
jgi:amiloride-sensitive sodium channel